MSEKAAMQTAPMYTGYPPNRVPYTGPSYQQYSSGKSLDTHLLVHC
jgi:hypothetical protein